MSRLHEEHRQTGSRKCPNRDAGGLFSPHFISMGIEQDKILLTPRKRDSVIQLATRALALLCLAATAMAQRPASPARPFPVGSLSQLDELPAGRLRARLGQLPPTAQQHALQWLRSFHFTESDLPSLHADSSGGILYVCSPLCQARAAAAESPTAAAASVP